MAWEVTARDLGFPLPPGYRVLEDEQFVVVLAPDGRQIFNGSAIGATREAIRAAIGEDFRAGSDSGPEDAPDDTGPNHPL